jgi:serine phosphatase RsbU (regulator of sigma subunit)/transcriptional regulator with GAF, ATPase, and Fis domain/anti-sigma regulatory factor (Ser/Thr protein kinase)
VTQTPEAAPPEGAAGDVAPEPAGGTHPRRDAPGSDRVLETLLSRLRDSMRADIGAVLLERDGVLRVAAALGVSPELVAAADERVGHGFAGTIAATCAPGAISDTMAVDAGSVPWAADGVRALVGVPLVSDDRVLGVAIIGSRSERIFGDGDIELLAAAAEHAAWVIDNGLLGGDADTPDSAATATERLRRLQAMSQELLTELSVDGVISTVVRSGLSLLGANAGGVWELDASGRELVLRGMVGYPPEVETRWARMNLDERAPATDAARTGHRVVLRSIDERDERYPRLRGRASVGDAFLTAPLVVHGRTIGVIGLGFERATELDEEGLAFIDAAVAQCAAAMHRALVVETQQQSLTDAQETTRRLAALQRLTARLADARDNDAVIDAVIEEASATVGSTQVTVCVLDDSGEVMRGIRYHGLTDELAEQFAQFPFRAGLPAADALLQRRPIVMHNQGERDQLYPSLAGNTFAGSWACLPLAVGNRDIGALALTIPSDAADSPGYLQFLVALADQCAHALDRARLLERDDSHRAWLELLAEAGRLFSAPMDVRLTCMQLCRLLVGRMVDGAGVFLRQPHGGYSLAASRHVDQAVDDHMRVLAENLPPVVSAFYDGVLACGTPVVQPTGPAGPIGDYVASIRMTCRVVLPLIAGGRDLGVLVVMTTEGGRAPLDDHDVEQLEEVAARLALATDGALLLRQQTEIAHTLQRSLLPASLPQVPGAEVAVRYLPGTEGVDVGGDFYDVIPLPSGRIGLVVGDVMGRGLRAAAVMGQLRAAVRSYSLEGHPPAALLARLDLLVGTLEDGMLVTAVYGEWDPRRGLALISCAGHLPPLVRLPGRDPEFLELDPGLPLGVGAQDYVEREVSLPPGSLLLGFTDGLVEGKDLPVDDGMSQLLAAMTEPQTAMAACDAALAALRPLSSTRKYDDDTALLALVAGSSPADQTAAGDSDSVVMVELPADTTSPARARSVVADVLRRWQLPHLIDAATLLVSELVTNGVRHAGTGMRLTLTRQTFVQIRIAVTDKAPAAEVQPRPRDDSSESGRGLFLVEHLSTGWGSAADDHGKTVWFELRG